MKMNNENLSTMHTVGDTLSLTTLFGYFFAGLPTIALLLTVIWTTIRILETKTVQSLIAYIKGWMLFR